MFLSSGDLTADRRYAYASDLAARGDDQAAAELFAQAAALVPAFAAAWFAQAECLERLNRHDAAIAAYRAALAADTSDRHGAGLKLMRLGAAPLGAMTPDYVASLFDDYAGRFERSLVGALDYRGPELLRAAIAAVCREQGRPMRFAKMLDCGCGTGLAARAFATDADAIEGFDLSPNMVAQARATGLYISVSEGEMVAMLAREPDGGCDLVIAADAVVYLADLAPFVAEAKRVLRPGGLLAFTCETHAGEGVVLGAGLRYAHGRDCVEHALASAGLRPLAIDHQWARKEKGTPVPGLVVVAQKYCEQQQDVTPYPGRGATRSVATQSRDRKESRR